MTSRQFTQVFKKQLLNKQFFLPNQTIRLVGTAAQTKALNEQMPRELRHAIHPQPIRSEFLRTLDSAELEKLDINESSHREPSGLGDRLAFAIVKLLRVPTDMFFRKKYVHRAVMLETVAAVPGMVGATLRHLRSLRLVKHDGGWITHLLHEAENERMHLLTWMRLAQPSFFERCLITVVQGVFFNVFFSLYIVSPKTAHRITGYLEEEAVISYTSFIEQIDLGSIPNGPAPDIAIEYWHLAKDAKIRDVVLAVRADEANHRDTNHHFADRIVLGEEDLRSSIKKDIEKDHQDLPTPTSKAKSVW